jgi:hypothetical protein
MKIIALLMSCVCGAVLAYHDEPLFVNPTPWAMIAGAGIGLLLLFLFVGKYLPALDHLLSASVGIFLFGFIMALAVNIWPNHYFVGTLCILGSLAGMFVFWFTLVMAENEVL